MLAVSAEWRPASTAPSDRDLEICALDFDGIVHTVPFPCHRDGTNWLDCRGKALADIQPTHWRKWPEPR
jgi:hypothetical protein